MVITKNIKIDSSTTFTTPLSWQKNFKFHFRTAITMPWSTWNERSSLYCHYVHYAMVMSKKYEVLFDHYTHYTVIHLKKTNFNSILETISILRSLLRWSWQIYIFTFQHYIHYTEVLLRSLRCDYEKKRLCSCWYYAHYAMILPKNKSIYILTLLSLSIYLVVAATFTAPWSWHKINFYSNTIFTTQFLIKKE